jgi:Tol biopolymer transport system component
MANKLRIIILVCIGILVWGGWSIWRNGRFPATSPSYQLLYLAADGNGITQLFKATFDPGTNKAEAAQLSRSTTLILNYAPSPTGGQIVYSTQEDEATTAVWIMSANGRNTHKLLTCEQAACDQLVWHPDGRRLVYERREADAPGVPHLYWLDTKTATTIAVLSDETEAALGASFSPDGEWIAYVSPTTSGLEVYNFADGRRFNFSDIPGRPAIWNSHSHLELLIPDQLIIASLPDQDDDTHDHAAIEAVHLFLTNLETGKQTSVSGGIPADDASASWSPVGEWILFGRKLPRTAMGRQLWLVRPDGTEAHALTDEPEIHHGIPSWSGDGRYVLYQRFPVTVPQGTASIWLLDMDTGQQIEIAPLGTQPAWLP